MFNKRVLLLVKKDFDLSVTPHLLVHNVVNYAVNNRLYRVIREERSMFWEVIIWIIVRKEVHINMCPTVND